MDVCNASLPQHLPDLVLDIIFSNLKLSDLYSCMLVCRNWNRAINDGSSEPWKSICRRELTKEFLESDHLSPLKSHKDKIRALCHSWNPDDCSKNIVVENRGFTFVRNLIAESTDMVRTKIGYNTGKHTWEITWIEPLGTVAMIGVSTKDAPLRCDGYEQLLGANKYSWGWNLVGNTLVHNAIPHGNYPLLKNIPKNQFGENLRLVLDCEIGTLHFEKNNVFLGIAFENLPTTKLYPSVSVVYGKSKVKVLYIGNTESARRKT